MRMKFGEFKNADDLEGFELPPPGTYHLIVSSVDESDASGIKMECQVLSGTVAEGIDKVFRDKWFFPSEDHKDGGKTGFKRFARLLLAAGVITETQLGSDLDVDWQWLTGRQFIAKVKHRAWKDKQGNDGVSAEIDGFNVWHLNDPKVAGIPKHNAMAEDYLKHGAAPATAGASTPTPAGAAAGGGAYEGL